MKIRLFVITLLVCVFVNKSAFAQLRYYAGAGYKYQLVTENNNFRIKENKLSNQWQFQAGVKKHWNRIGGDISIGYFKNEFEFEAFDSDNLHYLSIEPQFSWRWHGSEPKNIIQTFTTNVGWQTSFLVGETRHSDINKRLNSINVKFLWNYKFIQPYISFGLATGYFYKYSFSAGSPTGMKEYTIKLHGNFLQVGVNMVLPYK